MLLFGLFWLASQWECLVSNGFGWLHSPHHPVPVGLINAFNGAGVPSLLAAKPSNLSLVTALAHTSANAAVHPPRTSQSDFQPIQTFVSVLLSPTQNQRLFQVPRRQTSGIVQLKETFKTKAAKSSSQSSFQIWVQGRLVAETPNRRQAESLVRQLRQIIQQDKLDPSRLQPALVKGKPAGKWGDRTLFTIDSETARYFNRSGELIAIEWVNQLRTALAAPPLPLSEAQTRLYKLVETPERLEGLASWYGPYFHGRLTAAGETFNQNELTAAHPSLPFDTYLKVTNLQNGRTVIVRVNDRGPYWENRTLDLSREAARRLDSEVTGVIPIEVVIMQRPS